jgi:hypothetical protein
MQIKHGVFHLGAVIGLLPMVASAGDVQSFQAPGLDLAVYRTYRFLPTRILTKTGVVENDPKVSPVIVAAIRRELSGKGLVEVAEGADVEVAAGALTVSVPQLEAVIFNFNLDASWGTAPITMGRYNREGTLVANFIDPRTQKSIWIGIAKRALGKPANYQQDINKAAHALFQKYPQIK